MEEHLLTDDQISGLASLAKTLKEIESREERTIANTRRRYAIERGRAKAESDPEVCKLHNIDVATDVDVKAYLEHREGLMEES